MLTRSIAEKDRTIATLNAQLDDLRGTLTGERKTLTETRDQARTLQHDLQRAREQSQTAEQRIAELTAAIRERQRRDEDAGRRQADDTQLLQQTRDLLAAAETERLALHRKSEEHLALLKRQEQSLRDLEERSRLLVGERDAARQDLAEARQRLDAQAETFARETAAMKAKTEVVDGLTASLSDVDAEVAGLKRQLAAAVLERDSSQARAAELRRQVQERDADIARSRAAAAETAPAREKHFLGQIADLTARLEQETAKRRALEEAIADNPAAPAKEAASDPLSTSGEGERDRRERERQTLLRGYLRQAVAAEKEGKAEAARWNYLKALDHDGESKLATQRLGLIAVESGNDEDAVLYLKRAFKLDPDDLQTIIPLGFALLRRQEADLAISMLSRAVALEPDNPTAQRCLGLACSALGWYDAAEVQFRRTHGIRAEDGENAFNLAVLLASRQPPRLDEAREWYERAIALGVARDPGLDQLFGLGKPAKP